jgi:hypothetical protein
MKLEGCFTLQTILRIFLNDARPDEVSVYQLGCVVGFLSVARDAGGASFLHPSLPEAPSLQSLVAAFSMDRDVCCCQALLSNSS